MTIDTNSKVHQTTVALLRGLAAAFNVKGDYASMWVRMFVEGLRVGEMEFGVGSGIKVELRVDNLRVDKTARLTFDEPNWLSVEEAEKFAHDLASASRMADQGCKVLARKPADVSWREIAECLGDSQEFFNAFE